MPAGRRKLGNKRKKKRGNEQTSRTRMDEEIRPGAPCPFGVDLILQLIFSYLEVGDLLQARLVAKNWTPLATEECRGRKTVFPWIGRREGADKELILDEGSAVRFMDVMTPSLPLIPVQQIALRVDLLSINTDTLLSLLSFIAPWIKTLRLVPWGPTSLDVGSSLMFEDGRKAMTWSSALQSFPPLDFPRLETLELGEKDGFKKPLHQTLAMSLVHLVTKIVKGARGLERLGYFTRFFVDHGHHGFKEAETEATSVILQALTPSLKRLGFGHGCEVNYGTLNSLGLNLEEFLADSKPETGAGAFLTFLEGQKTGLKRLYLPNLEKIYDSPNFPKLPFVTELEMYPRSQSSFECLEAFPTLLKLQINIGWWEADTRDLDELSTLPAHPGVRRMAIDCFFGDEIDIPFTLIKQVLPNLTHVAVTYMELHNLTPLFKHLPRLVNLKLNLSGLHNLEGLQSLLSGIHASVLKLAKDFDIFDTEGFTAVEVIGSRRGNSTVGLWNLKDLQVLDISDISETYSSEECNKVFLSKLTFGTVFMKMRSLKEIRIAGKLPKACKPVLEALRNKGIHVRVYKVKQ